MKKKDTSPYIIHNVIYNYKMPKHIYNDLKSQATLHHIPLKKEIYNRLLKTFDPEYTYLNSERITRAAIEDYKTADDMYVFRFDIPEYMATLINDIRTHRLTTEEIIDEMDLRLMYTLYDPFYDN